MTSMSTVCYFGKKNWKSDALSVKRSNCERSWKASWLKWSPVSCYHSICCKINLIHWSFPITFLGVSVCASEQKAQFRVLPHLFAPEIPHKSLIMLSKLSELRFISGGLCIGKDGGKYQTITRQAGAGSKRIRIASLFHRRAAMILAERIFGDINETVGSFHNEISKIHLELSRWVLLRWPTMKAIGYNSAVINLWWRKWF